MTLRARFPDATRMARDMALALTIGVAGGAIFAYLTAPLPWMLGAAFFTVIAALAGVPIRMPAWTNAVVVPILGVMLGSTFAPETLDRILQWGPSLAGLFVFVLVLVGGATWFLTRWLGYGPVTAFFSAAPGGYMAMYTIGTALGGDARSIALIHATRAFLTIFIVPFFFRIFADYHPTGATLTHDSASLDPVDLVFLTLAGLGGYWVAKKLRMAAPFMMGPLIASAAVHMAGLTAASPPDLLVIVAQIFIGAGMGTRFLGASIRSVASTIGVGALLTALMMALGIAFAALLAKMFGLPFFALVLAFAPGGIAEMALVSLALNLDTAFVSTHHLVRFIMIMLLAPVAFRVLARIFKIKEKPDQA